ncbi:hypothetical protein BDA96_07G003400 [Sorghum bicolor]|uniref:Uncharacterized protein n=2 Tax=Sorghum bicolor TaxID=4558 RepID=A0A921QK85_SORBI|nr:indole-2-monooxygenase isoform X3 [Sorghum bicolor]EES13188.1 hypothetical protein SORBI_3007G003400 [Sorghum bicolor]KAG0522045.1 hypothetical protein BDA96_07G003400 [Sorghum bicolor]KAG0522046.1 hypothetical protein BDA96_07G003400 [Sorghum bicolor]|eukprot:XP_002443693.1 indole-2-monooxygenase isoform X3 [Sorghum bicolor]
MSRLEEVAYQLSSPLVQVQWLLLLLVPLLLRLHYYYASRRRSSRRHGSNCSDDKQPQLQLPPSPPGLLPIIGHLHLIGDLPHVSLCDLAAKHAAGGDGLMLLHLGAVPTLIVSTPQAANAIMRTHDHVFASRPASTATDDLMYGSTDIAFSPYGEHWRQARKLVTSHLFTVKKVQSYRSARKEEVRLVLAKLHEAAAAAGTAVDMSTMMNTFANDIVSRAVSGKFFRAEGRNKLFRELVEANSALFGGFNLEDYFPGLARSLGFLSRRFLHNRAQETHKRWDELLETILSDHERRNSSLHRHRHDDHDDGEGDFTDVLLSVQKGYGMTRDHVKAILVDMFSAGTDTSSLVLELAMAELMRNPQQKAKLQGEVRKHTPEGQETVEEEDIANMPYLRAVVKETLRLHPPVPLLLPRLSMADCIVQGYYVPSGTRVIVNAWALGRDPESWQEKPEEFMPERFMDGGSAAGVDFKGNHFQFLPFGAGRRICPGLNFGMATVEIMLANLMYCFDWQLPSAMEEKGVDMTEVFGLTVHPKEKLMLVPKLPGAAAPATS